jgi:hypothetical protein
MNLTINYIIKKGLDNSNYSFQDNAILNQTFLTNNFDSNDFKTQNYFTKDDMLEHVEDESDSQSIDIYYIENILNKYGILKSQVSFIFISLQDVDTLTVAENDLRFRLKIDSTVIELAQIALFNLKNLNNDFSIIDYIIPEGKQGLLKIIIGQK